MTTMAMIDPSVHLILCENREDASCLFDIIKPSNANPIDIEVTDKNLSPSVLFSPLIQAPSQKKTVFDEIKAEFGRYRNTILVFSLDFGSPLDAAPAFGRFHNLWLAPAVPNVISWLLSDHKYYMYIREDRRVDLPSFEEFLSNKESIFLNSKQQRTLLQKSSLVNFDVKRAAMVSPSLRNLLKIQSHLRGAGDLELHYDLNKALLVNLIAESYPANKEIYRHLDGSKITGQQMVEEIKKGSEVGRKYTSDLLRVSRDMLSREARRH